MALLDGRGSAHAHGDTPNNLILEKDMIWYNPSKAGILRTQEVTIQVPDASPPLAVRVFFFANRRRR